MHGADRNRAPRHTDQAVVLVGNPDIVDMGGSAAVERRCGSGNPAVPFGADVGRGKIDPGDGVGLDVDCGRGRERCSGFGEQGGDPAVEKAEVLAVTVVDGEGESGTLGGDLDDLDPERHEDCSFSAFGEQVHECLAVHEVSRRGRCGRAEGHYTRGTMSGDAMVRTGMDALARDDAVVAGRRVALLANQAAVTRELTPAWEVVRASRGTLIRMLTPEHGLWGVAQDMEAVTTGSEVGAGIPAVSLYGKDAASLRLDPGLLDDVDALLIDLPDIGCRYYTFAATMAHALAACEVAGVEAIVLDRPNPIGGIACEGGPVAPECVSFVSELPVPVRHGLTLGELALFVKSQRHQNLQLTIVPCVGWRRGMWWDETGLPWVGPSPNMPTLLAAALYPGACLVEATTLSEGRGTTRPFQLIGAPWIDGEALAAGLNALGLPGCGFRATKFRPQFQKHGGAVCGGVEWHVTDRLAMRPLEAGIRLLAAVRRLDPERFGWRLEPYEFISDVPAIDLLTGSAAARLAIEGRGDLDGLLTAWSAFCDRWADERRGVLLYPV